MSSRFGRIAALQAAFFVTASTYIAYAISIVVSAVVARSLGPADWAVRLPCLHRRFAGHAGQPRPDDFGDPLRLRMPGARARGPGGACTARHIAGSC